MEKCLKCSGNALKPYSDNGYELGVLQAFSYFLPLQYCLLLLLGLHFPPQAFFFLLLQLAPFSSKSCSITEWVWLANKFSPYCEEEGKLPSKLIPTARSMDTPVFDLVLILHGLYSKLRSPQRLPHVPSSLSLCNQILFIAKALLDCARKDKFQPIMPLPPLTPFLPHKKNHCDPADHNKNRKESAFIFESDI